MIMIDLFAFNLRPSAMTTSVNGKLQLTTSDIVTLNSKLSSKLDSSKILLSTTTQMRFSVYESNPDDYDIDFRRSESTIIKFRFHITNSNVDVYETRDNGASWTQRRSGNNYIQ